MQVILKPVTRPELGEIIINHSLFAIGRHEQPFANYEASLVAKLSRRHARVFEQDGVVYIADMGSLNGTSVNGRKVDNTLPVRLQRGDLICFTDLCYEIEILGSAARQATGQVAVPILQLVLVPEKQKLTLEPIVVTRFPFLVNKASDVFARYRQSLPEQVSYISRRHAHLFLNGRDLYIEDLGSTNGTFVNGERLEEHARQLHDGDVVAFGGDNFVYRAQLLYAGEEAQSEEQKDAGKLLTATVARSEDVTRTTFVTSADSFLDIYCSEGEQDDEKAAESKGGPDAKEGATVAVRARRGGMLGKPLALLRELRKELAGEKKGRPRKYWLAALLLGVGVGLWVYLDTAPRREIQQLLDSGDYLGAVTQANHFLAMHPGDPEVGDFAAEALLKAVVPDWQRAVQEGDFGLAAKRVAAGMEFAGPDTETRQLLEIMQWITRLENFVAQRGGADAPVVLFRDEEPMRELTAWWNADDKAHRRRLGTIAQYVPGFLELRSQVFSHVRALDSQQALSLAAIERLLDSVRKSLQNGDPETLHAVLAEFEKKYPRVKGVDRLRTDLDLYELIDADMEAGQWVAARRRVAQSVFETPPFLDHVRLLTERELPPMEVVERYDQADADWQAGNTDQALAALEGLRTGRWGEVAERRLALYRDLLAGFEDVRQSRDQADYEPRLLAFFRKLDPARDRWIANALAEDFRVHSDKAVAQAERDFASAKSAWSSYREQGGIRPVHRLEGEISGSYRRLAELLSAAWRHSSQGSALLELLDSERSAEWDALHTQISNEVRLQRQSLGELAMVLEPSLKQAKLDLLPATTTDGP